MNKLFTYEKRIVQLATLAFIFLWCYTLAKKLMDVKAFKWSLFNQPLPHHLALSLLFILPFAELMALLLLFFKRTQLYGLYLSLTLIFGFTIYIALVISRFFDFIPCSCSGVLGNTSWSDHLYFNVFLLILSVLAIVLKRKKPAKSENILTINR